MKYTEYQLEQAFIEFFQGQGYVYENGKNVARTDKKRGVAQRQFASVFTKILSRFGGGGGQKHPQRNSLSASF
ncbi:hypothetical protein QIU18_14685 [Capnocytophaga canimorsus]|nr:hypothetical protein [Capnocytophaga canimorsus]WGU68325.1 hypothetical protein QIU19_13905 [Capnocytophaga canimorsus]WGU70566.1 hypothetical protein QIU18_14685 [Capnocytophaga canimorsus]